MLKNQAKNESLRRPMDLRAQSGDAFSSRPRNFTDSGLIFDRYLIAEADNKAH